MAASDFFRNRSSSTALRFVPGGTPSASVSSISGRSVSPRQPQHPAGPRFHRDLTNRHCSNWKRHPLRRSGHLAPPACFMSPCSFPLASRWAAELLAHLAEGSVRLGIGRSWRQRGTVPDRPEGNGLELYVDRPPAAWPPPEPDGQVAMFTDPLDLRSLMAAGEGEKGARLPPGLRIGHVHLSVSSLERAEAFYGNELGFAVRQRSYPGALFLARDGYHHHLGMNTWRSRAAALSGSRGLARISASGSPIARSWSASSPEHAIASSVLALRAARCCAISTDSRSNC